ncbi:hypothetical protein VQY16_02780 [Mesomycoplasma ovipneumoniae]
MKKVYFFPGLRPSNLTESKLFARTEYESVFAFESKGKDLTSWLSSDLKIALNFLPFK